METKFWITLSYNGHFKDDFIINNYPDAKVKKWYK